MRYAKILWNRGRFFMTLKKINYFYKDFQKAFILLQEAINEDPDKSIIIDGTIQRFEFTFELSWKLMKAILNYQGIDCAAPRDAIKEGFQKNLIADGEGWIEMLDDRNRTSHLYDEKESEKIYAKIKTIYVRLFLCLDKAVMMIIKEEK